MINNLIKFSNLSIPERSICIQAFFLLPLFALSLRLLGIRRFHALLARFLLENRFSLKDEGQIMIWAQRTARMVQVAGNRYPFRVTNCLAQSITVWWLLCRRGINSNLRIGVCKEAEQLKAHAWVECLGHVLNDASNTYGQFSPFHRPVIPGKVNSL